MQDESTGKSPTDMRNNLSIGLLSLSLAAAFLPCGLSGQENTKPNILFIMADDLGWADVEFHGGNVPTPNLNRLLSQGVELRQHYVAPVCSPTRTGLMTGRYWSRFGVTTPTNSLALPLETVTVAQALRDAGYETSIAGKWHLGSLPAWGPNHFGFDHSYGSLAGGVTPWSHFYKKGPYSITWHRDQNHVTDEGHVTDLLTAEAIRRIENRSDGMPFFLYVPLTAVHLPIREPQSWLDRVPEGISGDVPRQYAACILHLDDAVGRMLAAVERVGETDNTLVVFTSDNGGSTAENNDPQYPNDHCPSGKLTGNNLPLRGKKGDLYEGGTRVPTIVCWPGVIPAGSSNNTPVHVVDWMPTFCALAGVQVDAQLSQWDGTNIWPLLNGNATIPERSLYSAGVQFRSQALRRGDWKFIVFAASRDAENKVELFNIARDPNETNNLADSNPVKLAELQRELALESSADHDAMVSPSKLSTLESDKPQ